VAASSISARRYAEAAFDIAAEVNTFEAWSSDLLPSPDFPNWTRSRTLRTRRYSSSPSSARPKKRA